MQDFQVHGAAEAAKASPPVAVTVAYLGGVDIAGWVTILTFIYIILQLILLIPKYIEWYHAMKARWSTKCQSKQDSSKSE